VRKEGGYVRSALLSTERFRVRFGLFDTDDVGGDGSQLSRANRRGRHHASEADQLSLRQPEEAEVASVRMRVVSGQGVTAAAVQDEYLAALRELRRSHAHALVRRRRAAAG